MTNRLYDLRKSFIHAGRGIALCIRYERNMRIHIAAAAYVIFFALCFYELTRAELILLVLTCVSVLVPEIINTAIELLTDKASPEYSALAKAAKDVAAGSVLLASAAALVIGVILFWDVYRFGVIVEYFIENILALIALILSIILSSIFIFVGKERRKRGKRKNEK
jgi:diacylglycerol kinase